LKQRIKELPLVGSWLVRIKRAVFPHVGKFEGSPSYWKRRYETGGTSGEGSYGKFAEFKAEYLNDFVDRHGIRSVIEFGCGDGNQLSLARYPSYVGFDVSSAALEICRAQFESDSSKKFKLLNEYSCERAQLVLSLDVIYHLIEDEVYFAHMKLLFDAAEKFVVIYSSNTEENPFGVAAHEKHRKFSEWIEKYRPGWRRVEHVPNRFPYDPKTGSGSKADFYVYGAP
jgi:SAM-dependent methyltransferase